MKTYLTPEQFTNLFWSFMERKMSSYNRSTTLGDKIIWSMFQEYKKDVMETLEGSMWGIDIFIGERAVDLIGPQFHKSFRQTDVIPAKHIDMIIWSSMQDATVFWSCLDRACKALTNEGAIDLYDWDVVLKK